ncbi:hypothetical protein B1R32_1194 [Abditibacterium utsteinense]|uniref:Glycosyl transferase n=1 Tax=Abditibacterium utsteinense TaxID=1960156 RepID=A0A2S8SQ03_9BACT|nr:hypothetical protein [Abditibacterium utsteinense]PQV62864.1 hypothetical protein B1R32_1194 [Abditibacterium utsteinense]
MSIPIIFIHQGWSRHLEYALLQARRSNPDSPIFVLGGQKTGGFQGVTLISYEGIFQSAADFAPLYRHLSAHAPHFELFCLQRWFILSSFLQKSGISRCFALDSDVLLFTEVTRDAERFSQCDLTHLSHTGPLNRFINSPATLAAFCDHITKSYTDNLESWIRWFAEAQARGVWGGVSDMTIFHDFRRQFPAGSPKFADLTLIRDGVAYDHSIHSPDGYKTRLRRKVIRWKGGAPQAFHLETQQWIGFYSIHFQGPSKPLMRAALNSNRQQWFEGAVQIEWNHFIARVRNRLRRWRQHF